MLGSKTGALFPNQHRVTCDPKEQEIEAKAHPETACPAFQPPSVPAFQRL